MFTKTHKSPVRFAAPAVLALAALVAGPAMAAKIETEGPLPLDPVMREAEIMAPPNTFFLNNRHDTELVRFSKAHDVELCVAKPAAAVKDDAQFFDRSPDVPVTVNWDSESATIWPGNCMAVDAKSLKVRPDATIPDGLELTGTFRVIE